MLKSLLENRTNSFCKKLLFVLSACVLFACSSDPNINRAKQTGVKYWTDKAYPGKAFDVQVLDAAKTDDGKYRVKALIDGESRVGIYNPETETFDEGFYSLSHERGKKIAEQDEEIRYLKNQNDKLEKENYQLKLRLKYAHAGKGDPNAVVDADTEVDASKKRTEAEGKKE